MNYGSFRHSLSGGKGGEGERGGGGLGGRTITCISDVLLEVFLFIWTVKHPVKLHCHHLALI